MEWISVKDKLPDKDGSYLVCVKSLFYYGRCMSIVNYTLNYQYDDFNRDLIGRAIWYQYDSEYGDFERDDVTHWMPLPELPDEE